MSIITLTSDMGTRDYYVAAVKGYILQTYPDARIVDITHEISPFSITQAAFVVKNVYREFPKGTIHIIGIDPDQVLNRPDGEDIVHIGIKHNDHYFIGTDNGMFSLMFDHIPDEIYELNLSQDSDDLTFPTKYIFAKAACHLARGGTLQVIGRKKESLVRSMAFQPTIEESAIVGVVIYIDSYGNIITNITRQHFEQVGKGRPFGIKFRGETHGLEHICKSYNEVPDGSLLALFTSSGYLEIAVNKGVEGNGGGAEKLFGLHMHDSVRIEFENAPSSLSDLS